MNCRTQRRSRLRLGLEFLEPRRYLASDVSLVKDINPQGATAFYSPLVSVGSEVFFNADDKTHGQELWKTDGTTAGTTLVADLVPPKAGKNTGSYPQNLTNMNGVLFFSALDPKLGFELWRSDGTAAGTQMVADIAPGFATSLPSYLTNVNGELFFVANDGTHGRELWKSDGTAAGTVMVKDILPGSATANIRGMTVVNDSVFFTALDPAIGYELWKSDGTAAGTALVSDIYPGSVGSHPMNLTNVQGELFFSARTRTSGMELWKSDGTTAGTMLVKDINNIGDSYPQALINFNGELYFQAREAARGPELWKSDGTTAGTVLASDLNSGNVSSSRQYAVVLNGELFFTTSNEGIYATLWKYNPVQGAMRVNIPSRHVYQIDNLTTSGGLIFFESHDDIISGSTLWQSDGTVFGTHPVIDASPYASYLADLNSTLLFTANAPVVGRELFAYRDRPITNIAPQIVKLNDGTQVTRITVKDVDGHDDRLRLERSGAYLLITDQSSNPYSQLSASGVPGAIQLGSQAVKIPLASIEATGQPLAFDLGSGYDHVDVVTGNTAATMPIPSTGLTIDMGSDRDEIALVNNTTDNLWDITAYQTCNVSLGTVGKFAVYGAENYVGGAGYDDFRKIDWYGKAGIQHIDGGSTGPADKVEYFENFPGTVEFKQSTYLGTDTFDYEHLSKVAVTGGPQSSTFDARISAVTVYINGGSGNNTIIGSSGDDTLLGGGGNDIINGAYGNDLILGGAGNDYISGGYGNDNIDGQSGNDTIFGEQGNDILNGSYGNDFLFGGDGNDTLDCGDGNDFASGDAGNDQLLGGNGADILIGGAGADRLNSKTISGSDAGSDILVGGAISYTNMIDLAKLMTTWSSSSSYASRVYSITNKGQFKSSLDASHIIADGVADTYFGGEGSDLFLADISGGETTDKTKSEFLFDFE